MLTSYFLTVLHPGGGFTNWPRPPGFFDPEVAVQSYKDSIERVELADELGFDWVSMSEHHYGISLCPTPNIMASNLIAHVKRARIAVLGPAMPLNNPVRVAEELAMLDGLAEGRLVVGLLRGTPNEYQVVSANPVETREVTTEGMELVLKAWTEPQPFSWEGCHYQYRTVSIWPQPIQKPYPQMYALGNSAETCEFAARHRLGVGVSFGTFAVNGRSTAYYRECCEKEGWTPTPEQMIYRGSCHITETDKEADEFLDRLREGQAGRAGGGRQGRLVNEAVARLDPNPYHQGGAPLPGRNAVSERAAAGILPAFHGSPDRIVDQVKQCKEETGAGVVDFMFSTLPNHAAIIKAMTLLAKEVFPRIRNL